MHWRDGLDPADDGTRRVLMALFVLLTVVIAVLAWTLLHTPHLLEDWAHLQGSLTAMAFIASRARPDTLRRNALISAAGFVITLVLAQVYFSW